MKAISRRTPAVALLALAAACGSQTPSVDNQAMANGQGVVDNSMIVDPEIPSAPVEANGAAAAEKANESAPERIAPVAPAAPKAPPRAKTDATKPKAPPPAADPHAGHDMNQM